MRGNADATPIRPVAQAVIPAYDLVTLNMPHAHRHAAMKADVFRRDHAAVRDPIEHDALVEKPRCVGLSGDLARSSDRIPERRESPPDRLRESTLAGQGSCPGL